MLLDLFPSPKDNLFCAIRKTISNFVAMCNSCLVNKILLKNNLNLTFDYPPSIQRVIGGESRRLYRTRID